MRSVNFGATFLRPSQRTSLNNNFQGGNLCNSSTINNRPSYRYYKVNNNYKGIWYQWSWFTTNNRKHVSIRTLQLVIAQISQLPHHDYNCVSNNFNRIWTLSSAIEIRSQLVIIQIFRTECLENKHAIYFQSIMRRM